MYLFAKHNGVNYYLSINPEYPLIESKEDNVIRSEFEGGYEHTRARFTRNRKTFELTYKMLSDADKITLESLYDATKGADAFLWVHPKTDVEYNVRFAEPTKFEYIQYGRWNITIKLRVV